MKFRFLLVLFLAGCQAAPPQPSVTPSSPAAFRTWSIRRSYKRELEGPSFGYSLTVHSDGSAETESWRTGSSVGFKPIRREAKLRVSPQILERLAAALRDPELTAPSAGPSPFGELSLTRDDLTTRFASTDDRYSGAPGRVVEILQEVTLWPPADSSRL